MTEQSNVTEATLLQAFIERVKAIAWSIPAPNDYTPELMMAATSAEAELNCILAMTTAAPEKEIVERLAEAIELIDKECGRASNYSSAEGLALNIELLTKPALEAARKQG